MLVTVDAQAISCGLHPIHPSINWVWRFHKDDGRACSFVWFPALHCDYEEAGSLNEHVKRAHKNFYQLLWFLALSGGLIVCFRANHNNHTAIHTGCHRGGEHGPAMSSEPWPVSGAQVHLVLQRAAHPLWESWRIFWESGRCKYIIHNVCQTSRSRISPHGITVVAAKMCFLFTHPFGVRKRSIVRDLQQSAGLIDWHSQACVNKWIHTCIYTYMHGTAVIRCSLICSTSDSLEQGNTEVAGSGGCSLRWPPPSFA